MVCIPVRVDRWLGPSTKRAAGKTVPDIGQRDIHCECSGNGVAGDQAPKNRAPELRATGARRKDRLRGWERGERGGPVQGPERTV